MSEIIDAGGRRYKLTGGEALDELLPEPLNHVLERQKEQRERVRVALHELLNGGS